MESKWISTKDRFPICGIMVLITHEYGYVSVAILYCDINRNYYWQNVEDGNMHHIDSVIAWMPLPEPYKEDTNG